MQQSGTRKRRPPGRPARLSRDRVLRAALRLADAEGIEAVTMHGVARAVDAEPMSLYRHVRNKDDLLDGLVDLVYAEIDAPSPHEPWLDATRRRAVSARTVLRRHPWAVALMESRSRPGPANMAHHDAVVANLFAAGFSAAQATRAYNLIDSYVYGFAIQEVSLPFTNVQDVADLGPEIMEQFAGGRYPHLEAVATELFASGFQYGDEFEPGLDLILEALEREHARRDAHATDGSWP